MPEIKIKADEEGVAILNSMADGVDDGADSIKTQTDELLDEISQYPALGPHVESIKRIVAMIQEEVNNSTDPARVVADKLRGKAKEYRDWIDDDLFGGSGN